MSPRGRQRSAGPSRNISQHAVARRDHEDTLAREDLRGLPGWVTVILDRACADRLVRDEDLPRRTDDLVNIAREFGWTLDILRPLVAVGLLHEGEVAMMSWRGRASVAELALEADADIAARIAELREVAAA